MAGESDVLGVLDCSIKLAMRWDLIKRYCYYNIGFSQFCVSLTPRESRPSEIKYF